MQMSVWYPERIETEVKIPAARRKMAAVVTFTMLKKYLKALISVT